MEVKISTGKQEMEMIGKDLKIINFDTTHTYIIKIWCGPIRTD